MQLRMPGRPASLAFAIACGLVAAAACAAAQGVQDPSEAPRITTEEVRALQAQGKVLVVDVRSVEAYTSLHIAGAISVPLDEVTARAADLKAAKKIIVTYCA